MKFLQKILKEPLFHFFLLGAFIFALYYFVSGPVGPNSTEIFVSQGKIKNLAEIFSRTWQRPPTQKELQGLIDDYIREEILYREGIRLGLDQNDTLIRRRVGQKMDFIVEDDAVQIQPTDAQLNDFFQKNISAFMVEPEFSFRQIYFNTNSQKENSNQELQRKLKLLRQDPTSSNWESLGDSSLLDSYYQEQTLSEIKRIFGDEFAEQLPKLAPQEWVGPVSSSYGNHFLWMEQQQAAREPSLEEVHSQVEREWSYQQRKGSREKFYQDLRKNYRVRVEAPNGEAYAEAHEEK